MHISIQQVDVHVPIYKKRALSDSFFILACGERGIRTPGASQLNGFQDRRNRPLCHLSSLYFQKRVQKYCFFLNCANNFEVFLRMWNFYSNFAAKNLYLY